MDRKTEHRQITSKICPRAGCYGTLWTTLEVESGKRWYECDECHHKLDRPSASGKVVA
jgi:hypothetical protein